MKTRVSPIVGVSIFALGVALIGHVSKAQVPTGDQFGRKDYTLLDKDRERPKPRPIDIRGPVRFGVSDAELGTNRVFLRLGPTGESVVNLELLKACKVVIQTTGTNDIIQFSLTKTTHQLTNQRSTPDGTLEVEVTIPGSGHFILSSNEVTIERVSRNESR